MLSGSVSDCVVRDMGHCGISVYTGSKVRVSNNVITGSKYHGLRCTGGELQAFNNLIIHNNNRGIYLGNKSARGRVRNNVIMGNGTGIGAFAQSDVTIESNLILDSEYAGIGTRDSCRLKVIKNIFQGNTRGIIQFAEVGKSSVQLGSNCFWNNETDMENCESTDMIELEPDFIEPGNGNFTLTDPAFEGMGLKDPKTIFDLWENRVRQIDLASLRAQSDCATCGRGEFPWLDGRRGSRSAVLCGRNAVQLNPSKPGGVSLDTLEKQLLGVGQVERNTYLLRLAIDEFVLTVFVDGRTIVGGTDDPTLARAVHAKYIGS